MIFLPSGTVNIEKIKYSKESSAKQVTFPMKRIDFSGNKNSPFILKLTKTFLKIQVLNYPSTIFFSEIIINAHNCRLVKLRPRLV